MKKARKPAADRDTMRPEYDFSKGVRSKYAARLRRGTNVVLLDPDVAAAFGSAKAVNRALRALLEASPPRSSRARRRTA